MPPADLPKPEKSLDEIVELVGVYPREAFEFVSRGLNFTVMKIHGEAADAEKSRHVSGQQLCDGLRQFALSQWGYLAGTVLRRWSITRTEDFGRIVFALVDNGWLAKTDNDTLEDFKNVYDFAPAFDESYRIESKA